MAGQHVGGGVVDAEVFAHAAGRQPSAEVLKKVPAARELMRARPEDLVLISFSTHGHNGQDGRFQLYPSDMSKHSISSDDLTAWLRDVDAGEMVLIVDACHSAAAVEQEGFKPGPMGSRGLGQLAYDKRMRILAASQASDVAFEDGRLGHGLLTFALVGEGLQKKLADFSPKDGKITVGKWLRYGVHRVPELVNEIGTGRRDAISTLGRNLQLPKELTQPRKLAQKPALFDFTRREDEVLLDTRPAEQGGN